MQRSEKNYKRIVIKIGSSLFYDSGNKLDFALLDGLCRQIASLTEQGKEIIVVSSGAIALGMSRLKLESRPKELSYLQSASAVGQNELMDLYRSRFAKSKLHCAQLLLTWEDFSDHTRYVNACHTLDKLLKLGVIPVINENDTVSTDEIKFGDNDQLSAMVAAAVCADLLIILSDVEGLLKEDKKTVVRLVQTINQQIFALAGATSRSTSVGGMVTKLKAAKTANDSGVPCIIANGRSEDVLALLSNDPWACGTMFVPKQAHLSERQRWMAFGTKPKGKVIVDNGAHNALKDKKSLLSVGVCAIEGNFKAGDIVALCDRSGMEFGRGKISITAQELAGIKGKHSDKEVIHCDNMVIV